jgi:tripartite-type tricarboxylate transporter receptor subunit TctC
MTIVRRRFLHLAAGAAAMAALPRAAAALDYYPARPVRLIVGFPAGTGPDVIARLIGQRLWDRLGQQFIVENRSGAGSSLAAQDVVSAPADGYTLLLAANANAVNASLYPKLPFNFVRDATAVGMICSAPFLLVANPGLPAKTFPEFIAYAKANPGKIDMASPGVGTTPHLMYELLKMMSGIELVHVPYRTGYIPDLLSGQVQVAFSTITQALPYVKDGKLRALALSSAARSDVLPDVPAIGEAVPGYDASGWFGICAPKATPAAVTDKLNQTINAIVAEPDTRKRLVTLGVLPLSMTRAEFGKLIADDTAKWAKVIREANIKVE